MASCGDKQSTASIAANAKNQLTTLALLSQESYFTDSSPYLTVYPSQLIKNNCQTSNNQTWTCIVTLTGQNVVDIVVWNASSSNSGISFSPSKGYLAHLAPTVRVTISNIPCTNTSFLFSGQIYGGGGVFPTTITWSCVPQPTPTPRPTSRHTAQPSPTAKMVPTLTPTIISSLTPTITIQTTPVIASASQSDPPSNGNGDLAGNAFMISALIFTVLVALIELVIIVLMSKRVSYKRP
jgi:hypothetical protein